jgi:hypothetical protein
MIYAQCSDLKTRELQWVGRMVDSDKSETPQTASAISGQYAVAYRTDARQAQWG